MSAGSPCVFCERVRSGDVRWATPLAVAFFDPFPVTDGHALVIPRQHRADFFALPSEGQQAVWELVRAVRADLAAELGVESFNVGLNAGAAAGQTIWHAHLHVIPRRDGDVVDPRGGVRWVVPQRAAYWTAHAA